MAKRYESASPEVFTIMGDVRAKYYEEIELVSVDVLFIFDDDGEKCLTHQGYPAAAVAKITPALGRAAGLADAMIIIDRAIWQELSRKQKAALLDHELQHIELARDRDGAIAFDAQDRPKLKMRRHDWQFGWFDVVANRHGEDSIEVHQARTLVEASGQLYFDFGRAAA